MLAVVIAAGQAAPRQVSLIVTNATVVTMDAGATGPHVRRRWRSTAARSSPSIPRRPSPRPIGPPTPSTRAATSSCRASINTHTHAPMVLYRGPRRRSRPDGVAAEIHLPGRGEDRDAGVRARRDPARGARDDPVGDDDLRRHVLLRGGDCPGHARPPAFAAVLGQTIIQFPVADAKTPEEGLARTERVHPGVRQRRSDRSRRRAACDVYARCGDAEERAAARRSRARARHHPPRRDGGRGPASRGEKHKATPVALSRCRWASSVRERSPRTACS